MDISFATNRFLDMAPFIVKVGDPNFYEIYRYSFGRQTI